MGTPGAEAAERTERGGNGFVGQALKRKEDPRLITGRATYTDDMSIPGMLYAAIVRSPEAHARLTLPLILPVAETTEVPLTLTSDCAVLVRPLPAITLIVRGASGAPRVVGVRIPDLDRLWGFTLNDSVCPPAPPGPTISYAP